MSKTISYQQAGVSLAAKARWVRQIQSVMHSTYPPLTRVCCVPGAFAGLFRLDFAERSLRRHYKDPVLVGCADGVGTKVLLGVKTGRLFGLGLDLVAMNVNDLITCGAEPLFFLDYLAVHKLDPDGLLEIIEGIAAGCRQVGCALLGGETAEMPDLYKRGHLDLAGFALGVVEADRIIDTRRVTPGDILIGLPSNGLHANGYTLVRRLIAEHRLKLNRRYPELQSADTFSPEGATGSRSADRPRVGWHGSAQDEPVAGPWAGPCVKGALHGSASTRSSSRAAGRCRPVPPALDTDLADVLLRPTRIYVGPVLRVLHRYRTRRPITALGHITGGGLPENVARMLPEGCAAEIDTRTWTPLPIFAFLHKLGVPRREMFNVFNMGIGFVLAVRPTFVSSVTRELEDAGEAPLVIGQVKRGRRRVRLLGPKGQAAPRQKG